MSKLNIGLLLRSKSTAAWAFRMLERISASAYARIGLVVIDESRPSGVGGASNKFRDFGYRQYMRFEDARFRPGPDAFASRDLTTLIKNAERLDVVSLGDSFSETFNDEDLSKIHAHKLDVLLDLGFGALRGAILTAARQGVWSLHHGDTQVRRGGPAGFWELFDGESVTGTTLHILSESAGKELVLARTYSHTDAMLVKKVLNSVHWKSLSLIPRQLEALHRLGHDGFLAKIKRENKDPRFYSSPHYGVPGNREFLPIFFRHLRRYFQRYFYNRLYFHQWMLFFDFQDGISTAFWRFKPIQPPKDRVWADPHVVFRDGKYYVFIEELIFARKRAHISVFTINEEGECSVPVPVLERPYHLSYPMVFRWRGVDYMIPETFENEAIELYRCERFPDRWVYDRALIKGIRAADATLLEHDGKWWLFASVVENDGASSWDELFLYYAESPDSTDWKPHPLNPLVSDVRCARPAGKIFRYGDSLYRPAQDSGKGYGSGMRIFQITRLSETEYEEVEVGKVEPRWNGDLVGVHTLNHEERLTIIDGHRRRSRYFS